MHMLRKKIALWALLVFVCVGAFACGEKETGVKDEPAVTTEDAVTTEEKVTTEDTTPTPTPTEAADKFADLAGKEYKQAWIEEDLKLFRKKLEKADVYTINFMDASTWISKEYDGDRLTGFTVVDDAGKEIRFFAEGVTILADGSLEISPAGYIMSATGYEGIMQVVFEGGTDGSDVWFDEYSAIAPDGRMEIDSVDDVIYTTGGGFPVGAEVTKCDIEYYSVPPFFKIDTDSNSVSNLIIQSLEIFVCGDVAEIGKVELWTDFYSRYAEGDIYDPSKEVFSLDDGIFTFYLLAHPDVPLADLGLMELMYLPYENFEVLELYSADGTLKDKSEPLVKGDYLEVRVCEGIFKVELPICASAYPDTYYDGNKATTTNGIGDSNVLVVPVYFEDQSDRLEQDYETLLNVLGNAVLSDGTTVNRAATGNYFTFSDYFDQASYGKMNITSYVTDWYLVEEETFANNRTREFDDYQRADLEEWLKENYSEWESLLDLDENGIYDAVVLVFAGMDDCDDYYTISISGACHNVYTYGTACTKKDRKVINHNVCINIGFFREEPYHPNSGLDSRTLIHELSHSLGLIDYYDVYYSGYNAVGGYDMQSANVGDWNPFSKFAVGWITPTVVTKEQLAAGTTITISDFESSGDVILIPITGEVKEDGTINPFNEYLLVELFSPDGLNTYDAPEYGLTKQGVRIYHIDARLLEIDLMKDWFEKGTTYDVVYGNAWNPAGKYQVNLLQRNGRNTFTDGTCTYEQLSDKDLFKAGDSFSVKDYPTVFLDGVMNDGSEFPYTITVKSIENGTATIEIK